MPVLLAFVGYLIACMLLSAVLLPTTLPLLQEAFGLSPDQALYRQGMLLMLLGLPLLLSALDLRGGEVSGLAPPPEGRLRAWARGFATGTLMLALVLAGLLATGVRVPDDEPLPALARALLSGALSGLLSGLAVGLIEEYFFRGPLQGGMRRRTGPWTAALAIGAFYAAVHFVRPVPPPPGAVIDTAAALSMLGGGLAQLARFPAFADSFLALLLAGVFLSLARERTGSLWFAMGAHAGWVMVIRIAKKTTHTDHQSPWVALIGDHDNITGLWAALVILAFIALLRPGRRARH